MEVIFTLLVEVTEGGVRLEVGQFTEGLTKNF